MKSALSRLLVSGLLTFGVACDETEPGGPDDTDASIASPIRWVVRHADFSSASISLLAADGSILADDYINSGSTKPGLTTTIGGDVDLPTVLEPGVLTIISRYGTDVVTRIRLSDGAILGQVRTQGATTSGFSSNPQDFLYIDSDTAWVSRYSHNTMASVPGNLRGSDLLAIDPSTMTLSGGRIDLSGFEVTFDAGGGEQVARPRPKRIARVGFFAAVGLDLVTQDFYYAAPGKLAIVDTRSGAFSSFELPAYTNCGNVAPVPQQPNLVAVMCQGYNYPNREAESGVVIVSIDPVTGATTEVRHYATADHAAEDYVFDAYTMIDEDEFVGVHLGGYSETDPPDTLVHVNMTTGARATLFTSEHGSELFTQGGFDHETGLLLVPDTSAGLRRFQRQADGSFVADGVIELVGHGVPVRGVSVAY